jgi:hypothetical protein
VESTVVKVNWSDEDETYVGYWGDGAICYNLSLPYLLEEMAKHIGGSTVERREAHLLQQRPISIESVTQRLLCELDRFLTSQPSASEGDYITAIVDAMERLSILAGQGSSYAH